MKHDLICNEIRDRMPDVAAGFGELTSDEVKHVEICAACTEQLKSMKATMALLDEWQTPRPSPYFDTRLQARLREEMAKPQGWFHWVTRPVLAAALTVMMAVGVGFLVHNRNIVDGPQVADVGPGTAVSDLKDMENNHDLYSDFELLDDLDLQQDVKANP